MNEPSTPLDRLRGRLAAATRTVLPEWIYQAATESDDSSAPEERLVIWANNNVSRGKAAAAAVHAALYHYGIPHGAVIVLGASPSAIEEECDTVIRDAGRTEVDPGTVTAGIHSSTDDASA